MDSLKPAERLTRSNSSSSADSIVSNKTNKPPNVVSNNTSKPSLDSNKNNTDKKYLNY